jgi:hypothetical protein
VSTVHVADTGLFVAMGRPSNLRHRAIRTFALRHEITFVLPEDVYSELTIGDSSVETPPIDEAIQEGWAAIADPLAFDNPFVSRTMDAVRRYIAHADGRPEDEIEQADATLAGVIAQAFTEDGAGRAYVYTTDIAAGQGIEVAFDSEGYGDAVTFVNAFRLITDLLEGRYTP